MKLQFEASDSVSNLLQHYDPEADRWTLPREGPFWDAVRAAHLEGRLGEGRRVAIIDGAVDLSIPRLKEQSGGTPLLRAGRGEPKDHGTAVALLIAAVAPRCKIDIYETTTWGVLDPELVLEAISMAAESDADVVNLSLGNPEEVPPQELLRAADVGADHCVLCRESSSAVLAGKVVLAAAGNYRGHVLCPARCEHVVGVGFHSDQRTLKAVAGGFMETASAGQPSYAQSSTAEFTLLQPPGVLGSSFATPLLSGLVALLDEPLETLAFVRALDSGNLAQFLQALITSDSPTSEIEAIERLYDESFALLPHQHIGRQSGPGCLACAVFCDSLYTNRGLFLLETGRLEEAERRLRAAAWIAPWSPHAAANLGKTLFVRAEGTEARAAGDSVALLRESADLYRRAVALRPGFEPYERELQRVVATIDLLRERT